MSSGSGIAWRQSLGAGLLLGLGLGCGWLVRFLPLLYARVLLLAAAVMLCLLGLAVLLSVSQGQGWVAWLRRQMDDQLSAAGMPFFIVLALLGIGALISGNNLLYLVVSGLLAALIVSGLTSTLNLSGMVLRFRLPPEMFAGRAVPVDFSLTNAKGFWPAYSLTVSAGSKPAVGGISETSRAEWASPVASRSPATERPTGATQEQGGRATAAAAEAGMQPIYFAYLPRRASVRAAGEICFPRRGRYAAAAFVVSTRFPFGLLRKRRRFQADVREPELLVFPAPVLPAEAAVAAVHSAARLTRPHPGDGPELHRIRVHQPGDSTRHLHWKATARTGELWVREFMQENNARLRLRLALRPGLPAWEAEAALSLCAGWLLYLTAPARERSDPSEVWLEFAGQHGREGERRPRGLWLPMAPAAQQRRAVLEYLALVNPATAAPPPSGGLDAEVYEILIEDARAPLPAAQPA